MTPAVATEIQEEDGELLPLLGVERIDAPLRKASGVLAWIGGVALVAMMLTTVSDVLVRLLLGGGIDNTIQMTSFWFLGGVIFLPLAYVEVRDRNISIEVLSQLLPQRTQQVLMSTFLLFGSLIFFLMAYQSSILALEKYALREFVTGAVTFYIWPGRFLMPLGTALFAIVLLTKSLGYLTGRTKI